MIHDKWSQSILSPNRKADVQLIDPLLGKDAAGEDQHVQDSLFLCLLLPLLSSCGDDSGLAGGQAVTLPSGATGGVPAPTPTPSPAPTPPSFPPVFVTLFADPLLSSTLIIAGKGWQFDYQRYPPYGVSNIGDADAFSAIYDRAVGGYRLTLPSAGSGLIQQISSDFDAGSEGLLFSASLQGSALVGSGGINLVRPGSGKPAFRHMVPINWAFDTILSGTTARTVMGIVGLAQPTPAGAIPLKGSARFDGRIMAYMASNGGDMLVGGAAFQIDRATGQIGGRLDVRLQCMMGYSYPALEYQLRNSSYGPGGQTFSADLTTAGTAEAGRLTATFAGPDAKELLVRIELPFYDPNYQVWTKAGGIVLARTD